jgi:hypothetical protein
MYCRFKFSNNDASADIPTKLKIQYKYHIDTLPTTGVQQQLIGRFWICYPYPIAGQTRWLTEVDGELYYQQGGNYNPYIFETIVENDRNIKNNTIEVSTTLDLTSFMASDETEYIIGILPVGWRYRNSGDDIEDNPYSYFTYSTFGDVVVTVESELQENTYTIEVVDNFINKKTYSINLFDTNNVNLKNGLFFNDLKTSLWTDDNGSTYKSIVEHLISSYMSYYSDTRLGLSADILIHNIPKPLTIIKDNYKVRSGNVIPFVLFSYSYDFIQNTASIECKEYGTETINIINL